MSADSPILISRASGRPTLASWLSRHLAAVFICASTWVTPVGAESGAPTPAAAPAEAAPSTPASEASAAPPASVPPAQTSPVSQPEKPPPPPVTDAMRDALARFLVALWPDAQRRGVSRATFDRAFAGIEPDTSIYELLENQPENVATPWDYMGRLVSDRRIENGRRMLNEHRDLLAEVEKRWNVDRNVVVAIWGVESSFGANFGTRPVVRSLATLAIGDPRRPQFWRAELLTALAILERGDIAPERMIGSWAGAMGHTQFMPSSFVAHAVDLDGDGRRDIWGSIPDALGSTAAYMKAAQWVTGEAWGAEVVLPAGLDLAHAAPGVTKPLADWQKLGLTVPAGSDWPRLGPSGLVLPAGAKGPAFLVGANFRAILRYNNAVPYALAVGHLADRLAGGPGLAGIWPTDDPPLSRSGREELQRRLAGLGYPVGAADGIIGDQTRTAIRAYQARRGLPADGWAGERLLERLRESKP
jgi:membrane-bound lytic murein transglycosylase B